MWNGIGRPRVGAGRTTPILSLLQETLRDAKLLQTSTCSTVHLIPCTLGYKRKVWYYIEARSHTWLSDFNLSQALSRCCITISQLHRYLKFKWNRSTNNGCPKYSDTVWLFNIFHSVRSRVRFVMRPWIKYGSERERRTRAIARLKRVHSDISLRSLFPMRAFGCVKKLDYMCHYHESSHWGFVNECSGSLVN